MNSWVHEAHACTFSHNYTYVFTDVFTDVLSSFFYLQIKIWHVNNTYNILSGFVIFMYLLAISLCLGRVGFQNLGFLYELISRENTVFVTMMALTSSRFSETAPNRVSMRTSAITRQCKNLPRRWKKSIHANWEFWLPSSFHLIGRPLYNFYNHVGNYNVSIAVLIMITREAEKLSVVPVGETGLLGKLLVATEDDVNFICYDIRIGEGLVTLKTLTENTDWKHWRKAVIIYITAWVDRALPPWETW